VLQDSALVPRDALVRPPPNRFTHVVRERQPYYYGARKSKQPDGELAKGARVVLMVYDNGKTCRVVNRQGLYVLTAFAGLRRLEAR